MSNIPVNSLFIKIKSKTVYVGSWDLPHFLLLMGQVYWAQTLYHHLARLMMTIGSTFKTITSLYCLCLGVWQNITKNRKAQDKSNSDRDIDINRYFCKQKLTTCFVNKNLLRVYLNQILVKER